MSLESSLGDESSELLEPDDDLSSSLEPEDQPEESPSVSEELSPAFSGAGVIFAKASL